MFLPSKPWLLLGCRQAPKILTGDWPQTGFAPTRQVCSLKPVCMGRKAPDVHKCMAPS